jgi:hypothetical protein
LAQVVYEARSYAPVRVVLAPAARLDRTPHSRLAAPTAVSRFVAAPVSVTLAAQRRGKTTSFLTSVAFERRSFVAVQTHLAPPTRVGRAAHSKLGEPTVVFPFLARPVSVELVRIRPPRTIARLTPIPTVAFFARPVSVELARTPQKSVVSALRPPTVIDLTPQVFYLNVTLAQIRPPKTTARIVPPAVVNPYRAPVSSFIQVHLAYSRRGRPIHHLGFVPGLSHGGIICGVILDLTSVCQDITADVDTIIDGGVLETHVVSETTTASTVIMGETLAETRVEQDIE